MNDEQVKISNCEEPPCLLKKRTITQLEVVFTPDIDVKSATNNVIGRILGLPLPFIGVDSTDACLNIYNLKGEKVGCPLKAGKKYLYKNDIKILPIYPTVSIFFIFAESLRTFVM